MRRFYRLPCSPEKSGQSGRGAYDPRERISASSPAIRAYVDLVHEYLVHRREVLRTPIRALEAEIGISRGAIDNFHKRKATPGKNWPKLRDWYMATRAKHIDEYQTPPELMVAGALQTLSLLPNSIRPEALRATAEHYRKLHESLKIPQPEWVGMLIELAEKESGA